MERFEVVRKDPNRSHIMAEVQNWIELYICDTDPRQAVAGNRVDDWGITVTELMVQNKNRWGTVCPYMKDILDREYLWLEELTLPNLTPAALKQTMRNRGAEFLAWPPAYEPAKTGRGAEEPIMWKTFVTVLNVDHVYDGWFPLMDETIKELVPDFVEMGVMIGAFYPNRPERGHYNPLWRGAQSSPAPLFVTRYLSKGDREGLRPTPFYQTYKKFFPEPAAI